MPRIYSEVDIVLELVEDDGMQAKEYCSQIVSNLVKIPFCMYNIKENSYKIFRDIEKAYTMERNHLAVNSGAALSGYIRDHITKILQ